MRETTAPCEPNFTCCILMYDLDGKAEPAFHFLCDHHVNTLSVNDGVVLPAGSIGTNDDAEGAFGALLEDWTFRLLLVIGGVGIGQGEFAFSQNFEAVVKVRPRH